MVWSTSRVEDDKNEHDDSYYSNYKHASSKQQKETDGSRAHFESIFYPVAVPFAFISMVSKWNMSNHNNCYDASCAFGMELMDSL